MQTLAADGDASTLERSLTVVKVAKPKQDMRFDVPVIGVRPSRPCGAPRRTCLAVEAGRTLIFDRDAVLPPHRQRRHRDRRGGPRR